MRDTFCPNCGERVDPGLSDEPNTAPCDNCEEYVEPITDSRDAPMPFKALHSIRCSKCRDTVQLVGLHMAEYTDGVVVACGCMSLDSVPYELGEDELPDQWEIQHNSEAFASDREQDLPPEFRREEKNLTNF